MGMADVAAVLFTKFIKFDASAPDWPDRDRFVLSAGHGSMLLYSLLYLTGYPGMTIEDIKNFRQLGSKTAGHPEYDHAPGIETTTGPLGQGITTAVGMAIAERMMHARFGDSIASHYTYVIAGDGCLMEGISHEAIDLAGHLKLNKLIVLWDDNSITIDGSTHLSTSTDQLKRFDAAGWSVCRIDGHNPAEIEAAIANAHKSDRPSLIACKTIIGYGAPNKQGSEKTHGAAVRQGRGCSSARPSRVAISSPSRCRRPFCRHGVRQVPGAVQLAGLGRRAWKAGLKPSAGRSTKCSTGPFRPPLLRSSAPSKRRW